MQSPRRHNIYALIHKALRLAMSEALVALGRLDASDPQEVSDAIVRVRDLLHFCKHHLEVENTFVHPALEARRQGSTGRIAAEHVEHVASIAALERKVEALARAPAPLRETAAFALYGDLASFVGENLVHMHEEETSHNRELWAAYTDDELVGIENAIKASITARADAVHAALDAAGDVAGRARRACARRAQRRAAAGVRGCRRAGQGARRCIGLSQARALARRLTEPLSCPIFAKRAVRTSRA